MDEIASFGEWLRRRRKALDLTQEEFARQVGCAVGTVKKLEADERRPSKHLAERLAECLEVPPEQRLAFLKAARAELSPTRLASPTPPVTPVVGRAAAPPQTHADQHALPTGTVTFLFTDIEGSTKRWEQFPDVMRRAFHRQEAILREVIANHGGYTYKMIGDAFQAAFQTAPVALAASIDAQRALAAEEWEGIAPIRVRMALHTGVVDERGDDYVGPLLNRVARLLAAGHGGQILLTAATQELVRLVLPPRIVLRDMGQHHLKDLIRPEHVFQVVIPDLPSDFPPLKTLTRGSTDRPKPQLLPGYMVGEQLGSGGFGAVYRAEQPGVGRTVAVKIILPDYANHPDFIRRFEAEVQIVARLEHPHIVPLYDYWREPNGAYLVMRYMPGGSLNHTLRAGGNPDEGRGWSLERSTQLLDQVGAALAFAHRHGVIHRDIKPANILLDAEGQAYLADFGIAIDVFLADEAAQTLPGAVVGSPAYLSPEQLKDEPITPQTDIYGLGLLMYETLTGVHPFAHLAPAERLERQLHAPLPPLGERRPDLPTALDEVIQRATAKDPAQRYSDVAAMVIAWQQALTRSSAAPSWATAATEFAPLPAISSGEVAAPDSLTVIELAVVENPYKGLRAFGEADAADFFGRAALTQRLLERMDETDLAARFLAVVGPSGSGKSSVVRAGLVPALRRGGLPGSEDWFISELLPGAHPWEEIEAALLRVAVNPPPSLLEQLQADERGLARAVKRALPNDLETELVLVIDQFEELWTLTTDEAVRAHVLDSLHAAVFDPHSRLRVIVTLRADFYDRPLLYGGFGELIRQRTEVVLPLTPEELRQAIVEPAARVRVTVEPELVTAIVHDVGEQPGTLPLLQYALTELFDRREGNTLTLAAYRDSGGILGALSRRADELYGGLDATQRDVARQLFLRLVTPGEGVEDTRRRVAQAELVSAVGHEQALNTMIEAYGRARLLTFDRDPLTRGPTVEVAHEALIRTWGRLRAWLEASREDLRMERRLAAVAAEWQNAGRDPSYLLSGARLAQFAGWADHTELALTREEQEYLAASRTEQERQEAAERERQARELEQARALAAEQSRAAAAAQQAAAAQRSAANRLRYLVAALALFLVVAIGLAVFAYNRQAEAVANLTRSERLRLAAEANNAVDRGESSDLPALLAIRSLQSGYTPQADAVLLRALGRGFIRQTFRDVNGGAAFSPDGKLIVTGHGNMASLWDVQSGRELRQFSGHEEHVTKVAFSRDGKLILTGSLDQTARLWDAQTGQELHRLTGHSDYVLGLAFSSDGKLVLTGSGDKTARLWDAQTGQELRQFIGHTDGLNLVAFSPDGRQVLTGSNDKTARLWDVQTGQELRVFTGHTAEVFGVAFSPDGKYVLTGSNDETARLWDVQTGQELRQFTGHTDIIRGVAFSPNGKFVLTASGDKTARLWDAQTGQQLRVFAGASDYVVHVAFSPDGTQIATGSQERVVRIWDVPTESEPLTFSGHADRVFGLALSPDGKQLLTASWDNTARLWDAQTGQLLRVFTGHTDALNAVAFSPDGKWILTGSNDSTTRLWDVQSGQELRQFVGDHSATVDAVAFSPDGRQVLTGNGNSVYLWDRETGQQLRQFSGHTELIVSVAFSPDGKLILSGSWDKTARLWDAQTGHELRVFTGHTDKVSSAQFSPDGAAILTASADRTARLWDARTGAQQHVFTGHADEVLSAVFSPDGKSIFTGSNDTTARLWDAQTGEQLRVFTAHTNAVFSVAFSLDGQSVFTGSWDGTARRWRIDYHDAIRIACAQLHRDLTHEERKLYNIADDRPTCPQS